MCIRRDGFFRILSSFETMLHRALFFLFTWIRTRWVMRFPGLCCYLWPAVHLVHAGKQTMGESRTSELLQHHEENTLSHRRKKYLSAGLAGVLCSTALFDLTAAHADGKTNLHLPGMRDRSHAPDNSFTRMFLSCRPSPRRPMPHVNRPKSRAKKGASSTRWMI